MSSAKRFREGLELVFRWELVACLLTDRYCKLTRDGRVLATPHDCRAGITAFARGGLGFSRLPRL
jgi:hypothetical protein